MVQALSLVLSLAYNTLCIDMYSPGMRFCILFIVLFSCSRFPALLRRHTYP
jgi:hypothetical protein